MQRYIENTAPSDAMASSSSAYEGGKLLGCFHLDLDDFPREQLTDPSSRFSQPAWLLQRIPGSRTRVLR